MVEPARVIFGRVTLPNTVSDAIWLSLLTTTQFCADLSLKMQSILDLNYLKSKYEAIGTDATGTSPENEAFLVDKEQSRTPEQTSPRPRRLTTVTALNILLLIISVSILVTSFKKETQLLRNENNSLLKAIDSYCKYNAPQFASLEVA